MLPKRRKRLITQDLSQSTLWVSKQAENIAELTRRLMSLLEPRITIQNAPFEQQVSSEGYYAPDEKQLSFSRVWRWLKVRCEMGHALLEHQQMGESTNCWATAELTSAVVMSIVELMWNERQFLILARGRSLTETWWTSIRATMTIINDVNRRTKIVKDWSRYRNEKSRAQTIVQAPTLERPGLVPRSWKLQRQRSLSR